MANSLVFKEKQSIGLDRCKLIVIGAAPASKETSEFFASLNIPLIDNYGMSEAAGAITIGFMHRYKLYSAGYPIPSTTLLILDQNGDRLPPRTRGEICYNGRHRFLGYYKNARETQAAIDANGFLHSGDEGYLNEEGYLYITGRLKELIITAGGENVPPVLLEHAIKAQSKLISNVFVVGDARPYLVALISLKSEPDEFAQPTQQLTTELKSFLAGVGSSSSTISQAIKESKVIAIVNKAVEAANEVSASRAQNIRKWAFIPGDFSLAGGELTPTMKVKRRSVLEKYKGEIESLYQDPRL
jgi:long-chain-fatty-acid--CoA ligase ACSBG